ncbi:transglutaminase domain-containing protein [Microbulbifer sp. MKSA007]|nr:transglutaminase domain-containing protein [Microbulbifer sp. MKSA007]
MRVLFIVALILAIVGCSQYPIIHTKQVDTDSVLSGQAVFNRSVRTNELPDEQLLELDTEIRSYLNTLSPGSIPDNRLQALTNAVSKRELFFEYDANSTLSAREAFYQQRGNCLTFTLMMVAMARELGVEAFFNEVDVPPVWSQEEAETFVIYRHVNMVSEHPSGQRIIDLNLEVYDPIYQQRTLDDITAFALYYSNKGVEFLREGDEEQAFLYLRKALQLRPERSDFWSNMGAFYSRFDHLYEAEQSYLQSLVLQEDNLVASSNLEWLYRGTGRDELAGVYADRVKFHRERNPYYLYYQARESYENKKYQDAEKRLRRAIKTNDDDHRFHFLLGLTQYNLGDLLASRNSFEKAFSLVSSSEVKSVYQQKLDRLLNSDD